MIHHHGTPITPLDALYQLAGRHLCVSHARPDQVQVAHGIAQSVMLDNGAFSKWKAAQRAKEQGEAEAAVYEPDWPAYYGWADQWLDHPTTWAVVPDVIDGGWQMQEALLREWPHGKRQAAPVWHMDEAVARLLGLLDEGWSRVCIGSTAEFRTILSPAWKRRMDEAWNAIARTFGRTPPVHMLRGMQLSGRRWPFASVDSTDIARNHNRMENTARGMADRWDAMQCPARWTMETEQEELL